MYITVVENDSEPNDTVTIQVRLPRQLRKKLRYYSALLEESMASIIRRLIEDVTKERDGTLRTRDDDTGQPG